MVWIYNGQEITDDLLDGHVGFVYCITNTLNGRKYIGKKLLKFSRIKKVKGKRKRTKVDSDWKEYYGSNAALLNDVETHGRENFHREILRLCVSKTEMSYHEAKLQFDHDVLLSEDYYNSWIMVRVRGKQLNVKP
jgi:Putative endonuclease segE, GIY-YIG domain